MMTRVTGFDIRDQQIRVAIQGSEKHGRCVDVLFRELQRETIVKHQLTIALLALFSASAAIAGPPAVEISGTVDTNIVNTVDANLVTTVSSEGLVGLDFGPSIASGVTAFLAGPRRLLSVSTSIAPQVPGDYCTFSLRAGFGDPTTITHIGFGAMSNGQVANASRNYDIPIDPVGILQWKITSSAGGPCWVSLSFVTEPSETAATASAQALAAPDAIRLEVR
jgi:hypothetical protein